MNPKHQIRRELIDNQLLFFTPYYYFTVSSVCGKDGLGLLLPAILVSLAVIIRGLHSVLALFAWFMNDL